MKNVECGNCKREISKNAQSCPGCGEPNKKADHLPGWAVLAGLALCGAVIWWLAGNGGNSAAVEPTLPAASPAPTHSTNVSSKGAKELAALMLNANELLCAEVLEIRPLQVRPEVHEVTCIEYRGGAGEKTYLMDTNTGRAWSP